jgi:hypothetical protein
MWLNKQLPSCMTRPECQCFEVLLKFINIESNVDLYISQSMEQLEYYMYLVQIHQNKETVVEIPYTAKVDAKILKKMIFFMNITRKSFLDILGNDKFCYIDFPNKSVQVLQYLNYVNSYCNYVDTIIETMLLPTSKIHVNTLKMILEIHIELLFIFEQYQRLKRFGYSFSSETKYGAKNMIQLFYCENKC